MINSVQHYLTFINLARYCHQHYLLRFHRIRIHSNIHFCISVQLSLNSAFLPLEDTLIKERAGTLQLKISSNALIKWRFLINSVQSTFNINWLAILLVCFYPTLLCNRILQRYPYCLPSYKPFQIWYANGLPGNGSIGYKVFYKWYSVRGLNSRHSRCKRDALPAELTEH